LGKQAQDYWGRRRKGIDGVRPRDKCDHRERQIADVLLIEDVPVNSESGLQTQRLPPL
jgi:hypothetical protein